ncbi:MAG: glycerol-3-phosphate acyltransferase [Lachnospiraceae bacterium]|nr:glycerol-3-phosphate acyltransferase [Lachnospiraceae bacterium]
MSFYLSKLKSVDIQSKGSRNLGASNAMILMGWKAGILVALHDAGKALLAVILARLIFPDFPYIGAAAGVASVLGHIFPFYLKFKGGKGFASFIGMTLALNWKYALVLIVIIALLTLITDYIVVGTATAVTLTPIYLGIAEHNFIVPAIICIATAVIIYKHRDNFVRIYKGTEIGLRSANRGDHRV